MRYTREQVMQRLWAEAEKSRLLGAGCSCGLIARCAEEAGADLIICYSTGKSRLMGLPTSRLGDSNAITWQMIEEIWNVTESTPIIAGLEANDPFRLDLDRLLAKTAELGASGIINFPSIVGLGDYYRHRRDKVGLGFEREVRMIAAAQKYGLFSMAYVYDVRDVESFTEAGVDCIVAHAGPTSGGVRGVAYDNKMEDAVEQVRLILERARELRPDVLVLAHGGPFSEPEDMPVLYEKTCAQGFVGASSIERIPIEKAVRDTVKRLKLRIE